MKKQEQELLEGYRKLRPESQRLIMATIITAIADEAGDETAVKRQQRLAVAGSLPMARCDRQDLI